MGGQAEQSSMMLEDQEELLEMYSSIFDIIYNWIVVVDSQGIIRMINNRYCDFLGVEHQEAVGKHVTEIIENTRMHIVAQNGRREIGDIQQIKGNKMIADRIPIYRKGQLIGAVGTVIFKDVLEMDAYVKRVGHMEKELDFFKKELKKALGTDNTFDNIIGTSQALQREMNLAKRVASTKSSVLLLGESGTGKGLFASAIHNASPRSEYPLIKVNCAAIPSELMESELLGYEGGAFTGAKKGGKPGKFELAHKSSIFLDEIGDLPLSMQAKLLKVLQEKEIERVGGVKSLKVDIRIIAATNRNLEEMVKEKTFREDLYYRLNVINIRIPSLRERKEDIPMLVDYLIRKTAKEMDRFVTEISPAAMRCLVEYQWPGNIRELENIIERAFNLVDKEAGITLHQLPAYLVAEKETEAIFAETSLKKMVEAVERKTISRYLEETKGNKYQAARLLGISRTSLYEKMDKYGIVVSG